MEHPDDGNDLLQTLYHELRKLAHARLRRLAPGQTLQTTALVHEAYLRLMKDGDQRWGGKRHFFGAAAVAMRDILVESARRKATFKRGGDHVRVDVPLALVANASPLGPDDLMGLHRSLEAMQAVYPEHAEVVSLHCFAGLPLAEVSEVMGVSKSTIERRWRSARAWLYTHMTSEPEQFEADMI